MFLLERFVTSSDLKQIEKYADRIFAKVGIDVEFTRHFVDRVNDERNKKQISPAELVRLFNKTYQKHGKTIARLGPDAQAVINDMQTDINMPFVLKLDRNGMLELIAKTIIINTNCRLEVIFQRLFRFFIWLGKFIVILMYC